MLNKVLWLVILALKCKFNTEPLLGSVNRILVMRYGFLGDVLQTTPVIKVLRKTWPNAEIHYWVADAAAPALMNNPHISSVISADAHESLSLRKPFAVIRHALMLRRARYDLAICLGTDPFYGFLAWLARIKFRVGLIEDAKKSAFLHLWIESPLSARGSHQLKYLQVVTLLNIGPGDEKIEMFWSASNEKSAEEYLREETNVIALFCGGGPNRFRPWANRRWRSDLWIDLARKLIQLYPETKILLTGTNQELETNKEIASALPKDKLIDLTGRTSFTQLGPILQRCRLLVSNDSAPVFVAAAVDCPVVVIYGPEWPERTRPGGTTQWYPVSVDIPCRDYCASLPDKAPECENECMSKITVEMVLERIENALNNIGESS